MRPLIAAEPMLRAPRPESFRIHLDGGCGSGLLGDQKQQETFMGGPPWTNEPLVVERDVGFDFVVRDFRTVAAAAAFGPDSDENADTRR